MTRESRSGWITATLRWLWGADEDVGPRQLFISTPATWILLAVVCAISFIDFASEQTGYGVGSLTDHLGISPGRVAMGEWWRLVTTAFVNPPELDPPSTGLQHLVWNAFSVVLVGPRVERAFGWLRSVLLFLAATVAGAVSILVGAPFYWESSGGTSGAVYGLLGAALVIAVGRRRRSTLDAVFLGAAVIIVIFLASQAPGFPAGTNVSHFGGFVAGSIIAAAWCIRSLSLRVATSIALAVIVVAGLVATLRVVDVRTGDLSIRDETRLGFQPEMVTPGFDSLWVTGEASGRIARVDPVTGRVVADISEDGASGLPVATEDRLWVPAKRSVAAIDPVTDRVVSRIRLSEDPWSVAATSSALWAALPGPGEVVRIDSRTDEQHRVAVGAETFVVLAHGENVWATSYGGRIVSRLDPDSGRVLKTRLLATAPYQMAISDGSLWVGAQPFVYRLDPTSLDVIAKIDVGRETWSLTPHRGKLVIAQRFVRSVVSIDPGTNAVEHTVDLGLRQPIGVAFMKGMWVADAFSKSLIGLDDAWVDR